MKRKTKHPVAYSHLQGSPQDPALHPVNNLAPPGQVPLGPSGDGIIQGPQGPQGPLNPSGVEY